MHLCCHPEHFFFFMQPIKFWCVQVSFSAELTNVFCMFDRQTNLWELISWHCYLWWIVSCVHIILADSKILPIAHPFKMWGQSSSSCFSWREINVKKKRRQHPRQGLMECKAAKLISHSTVRSIRLWRCIITETKPTHMKQALVKLCKPS